uniref:Uncharacterized protein n=1 Tax=Elaeophora elaphi TaxID=1147741 RepID=A0A0R3RTT7_9BILA
MRLHNSLMEMYYRLKDVHKREMFESGEKEKGNENHVVENFMFREHTPVVISSSILPLYRRTEFVVLSGGVVLYWITMIFIGTMLVMCCICSRSHDDDEEDEEIPKKKADEKTEEP